MVEKRDSVEWLLHCIASLFPANEETRRLIAWLGVPGQMDRLRRPARETRIRGRMESHLEAIEALMDEGAIPGFYDKWTRHQIEWHHVENCLRRKFAAR